MFNPKNGNIKSIDELVDEETSRRDSNFSMYLPRGHNEGEDCEKCWNYIENNCIGRKTDVGELNYQGCKNYES